MFCEQFHNGLLIAVRECALRCLTNVVDEEIPPEQRAFHGESPPDQEVGEAVGDNSEIQRVGRHLFRLTQVDLRDLLGDAASE